MEKYPEKLMMCVDESNGAGCEVGKIYIIRFEPFPFGHVKRRIIRVVDVYLWSYLDCFIDIPHGENTNEIKTWKQYNEGISMEELILLPDNIKSDIMDICLELTDNGFEVEIIKNNDRVHGFVLSNSYNQLLISKYKTYRIEEVSEVIERIKDF
jgi:hypothetical protein